MSWTALADPDASPAVGQARLYVAWQNPDTRSVEPVGRLDRLMTDGTALYEYAYLRRAETVVDFRPFVEFPDFAQRYRSNELFPLFENRLMARRRPDFAEFARSLGLEVNADPFELLARTEGRRQTDTVEVFPEPYLDASVAHCHFLVHGIRYFPEAQDAIDSLQVGDRLRVMFDCQNEFDAFAVALRDDSRHLIGWVPQYLTALVREPIQELGPQSVDVQVEHIGSREAPAHFRLLCRMRVDWPQSRQWIFARSEYEVMAPV